MKNVVKVDEAYRKTLMEQGEWSQLGIKPEFLEEEVAVEAPAEVVSEAKEEEVIEEECYTCPLCESSLENELSEDRISEHLDFVLDLLSESGDDDDEDDEDDDEDAVVEDDEAADEGE